VKDFAPIGLVGSAQFALVANPKLGVATLAELIALIKSKDGALSYASSGAATPHHLFMAMFLKMIGAQAQHVPYRGSVAALADVISGHIPMMSAARPMPTVNFTALLSAALRQSRPNAPQQTVISIQSPGDMESDPIPR
jgi:tripartite-type tricarboxylate transporter receptor subunit TctC